MQILTNQKIKPIHQHNDGLINSFSGVLIDYNYPDANMIRLDDIAKGLSNICRFGGQIQDFYSVAQHSLLVWYLSPDHLKRTALLHDAAEAYLGDVVKPLKVLLGKTYKKYEKKFEQIIFSKYGVDVATLKEIKPYDSQALEIENNYFRYGNLDFISRFYEINEILQFGNPYQQYGALLKSEFMQAEISYNNPNS